MPLLSHPAFGPRASLVYITVGSILDIIVTCWFIFMVDKSKSFEENRVTFFFLTTLFLIGLTLLVIGLMLGRIGQAARRSELPPPEAVAPEVAVQQSAAVVPVPVEPAAAPVMPAAPTATAAVPPGAERRL